MSRRKTTEDFIADAIKTHGNKYDYSHVEYKGATIPVTIICPIHGEFRQRAADHTNGHGCLLCASDKRKGKNFNGVSNNLYNVKTVYSYIVWSNLLQRTLDNPRKKSLPSYKDCTICEEWKNYENFKEWFDNPINGYIKGYDLDKDLLSKDNKIYSPDTCCFLPKNLNYILRDKPKNDGLPKGVCKNGKGYRSRFMYCGKNYCKQHNTIEDAEKEYKFIKGKVIKEEAERLYSENLITQKVYNALVNYCLTNLI